MDKDSRAHLVLKNLDPDELVEILRITADELMEAFPYNVQRFINHEENKPTGDGAE